MKLSLTRNVVSATLVTIALGAMLPSGVHADPPAWSNASATAKSKSPGSGDEDLAEKKKKGKKEDKKKAKPEKESDKKKKDSKKKEKTAGDTGRPEKAGDVGETKTIAWSGVCSPDAVGGATACEGIFTLAGQPHADDLNELNVFDISDWTHLAKVDDETGESNGGLTVNGIGSGNGTWSFSDTHYQSYMAVLKGGTSFSAFLLGEGSVDGELRNWRIAGATTTSGDSPALSNFALYGRGTPTVVPLPAASWLLIAAIGGLGVARGVKRRRAT